MKNFNEWNSQKEKVDGLDQRVFFHERDIWWCRLGINVGFEQDGKGENFARPVLVLKKFNHETTWILPLTTKNKVGKFYCNIDLHDGIARSVNFSQLRLVDAKRFYQKIGSLEESQFNDLFEKFANLITTKKDTGDIKSETTGEGGFEAEAVYRIIISE